MTPETLRGTGRSWNALAKVPDKGYFVIADKSDYYKGMLCDQGRASNAVKFVSLREVEDHRLAGSRGRVFVDHHAWDVATPRQREILLALEAV